MVTLEIPTSPIAYALTFRGLSSSTMRDIAAFTGDFNHLYTLEDGSIQATRYVEHHDILVCDTNNIILGVGITGYPYRAQMRVLTGPVRGMVFHAPAHPPRRTITEPEGEPEPTR